MCAHAHLFASLPINSQIYYLKCRYKSFLKKFASARRFTLKIFFMGVTPDALIPVWASDSLRCVHVMEESSFPSTLAIPCISFSWVLHLPLYLVYSLILVEYNYQVAF